MEGTHYATQHGHKGRPSSGAKIRHGQHACFDKRFVEFMHLSKDLNMEYQNLEEFLIRFVAFNRNVKHNKTGSFDQNVLLFQDEIHGQEADMIPNKEFDPMFVTLYEETDPENMGSCPEYEKLLTFLLELKDRRRMEKRCRLEEALNAC